MTRSLTKLTYYTLTEAAQWLTQNPPVGSESSPPWSVSEVLDVARLSSIGLEAAPPLNAVRKLMEFEAGAIKKLVEKVNGQAGGVVPADGGLERQPSGQETLLNLLGWGMATLSNEQIFQVWQTGATGAGLPSAEHGWLLDEGVYLVFDPPVNVALESVRVPRASLLALQAQRAYSTAETGTKNTRSEDVETPALKWTTDTLLALLGRYEDHKKQNEASKNPVKNFRVTFMQKELSSGIDLKSVSNLKKLMGRAEMLKKQKAQGNQAKLASVWSGL